MDTSVTQNDVFAITAKSSHSQPVQRTEPKLPAPDHREIVFRLPSGMSVPITMEIDSASPAIFVPYAFYKQHLSELPIFPTHYAFGGYSGAQLNVKGFVLMDMQISECHAEQVTVYIHDNCQCALLG